MFKESRRESQPQPRPPVFVLGVDDRTRHAVAPGEVEPVFLEVPYAEFVVPLHGVPYIFIAKTGIDRQRGAYLNVVLEVVREFPVRSVERESLPARLMSVGARGNPQKKAGDRLPGVVAIETD